MSRSPRAEALHYLRSRHEIAMPTMPDDIVPESAEAAQFLDDIKEARYVTLARLIDKLLGHAHQNRQPDKRQLKMRSYHMGNRWQALADNWRDELVAAQKAVEPTDLYRVADRFADIKGALQPGTHTSVADQLQAGAGTGISTVFSLLRNLPNIVSYHAPLDKLVEPAKTARHPRSLELTRRLSKLSINRAMAGQAALANEGQPSSWGDVDKVLHPEQFRLHHYGGDQYSLGYRDFANLRVPAGYRPRDPFPPTTEPTAVTEIPSFQDKVIGCPVTLLGNRLGQLWHWGIDLVEANDMWDERWPPVGSGAMEPALSRPS